MARIGVTYADVAKAAVQISQTGKTPTVDAVRVILGTGSKSTLSPLLKEWKAKHLDNSDSAKPDVPRDLLVSVKNLYEGIKQQADERIEKIQTQAKNEIEEIKNKAEAIEKNNKNLQLALTDHEASIKKLEQLNTAVHSKLNNEQQTHHTLQTQHEALQQRLDDRNNEIEKLNAHLQQTQNNLDHYRETTQKQREQERADFTHQRLGVEHTLKQSQHENQTLRDKLNQLENERAKIALAHTQLQAANTTLVQKHKQYIQEGQKTQGMLTNLQGRYDVTQETLNSAHLKIQAQEDHIVQLEKRTAVSQNQNETLTHLNQKTADALNKLRDKNIELKQDKASIEGQLKQQLSITVKNK